ncbi:MAG: trk system potassium uptake protein TrkA [Glaciecola sp.]|jgi:trk system potassium uptake protein TrkA
MMTSLTSRGRLLSAPDETREDVHIIVGGCGRLGSEIAAKLSDDPDHDVVAVDVDEQAFDRLGSAFNGETVSGDVTDRDVLERAGVEQADVFLALTRSDNANLMAVEVATHLYDVPRAVARLFNPERENVYRKLGVRYVSGTGMLVKLFLNEIRGSTFRQHLEFKTAPDVAMVDMLIGATGHGLPVEDFELDGKLRVAAISRAGRVVIPTADQRLERGDLVTAAVRRGAYRRIEHLLDALERER